MLIDPCNPVKAIAAWVLSDPATAQAVEWLSRKIEEARKLSPKFLRRAEADLESFVLAKLSADPAYRVDLIKSIKDADYSSKLLKLVDENGELFPDIKKAANDFWVSLDDVMYSIAKKTSSDYHFSRLYWFDSFYKRYSSLSEQYKTFDIWKLDEYVKIEYEKTNPSVKQIIKDISSKDKKSVSELLWTKDWDITKSKIEDYAKLKYDQWLSEYLLWKDTQWSQLLSNLSPSQIKKISDISSFIDWVSDIRASFSTEVPSISSISYINDIKDKNWIKEYIINNYNKLTEVEWRALLEKSIELDIDLWKRQQSFIRWLIDDNIDWEVIRMRANATWMFSKEQSAFLWSKESVGIINDYLEKWDWGKLVIWDIEISNLETVLKLVWKENLLASNANLGKLIKNSPWLKDSLIQATLENKWSDVWLENIFNITEKSDDSNPIFHRYFGINWDRAAFLDISVGWFTKETSAESLVWKSIYETNSAIIWQTQRVTKIENAIKALSEDRIDIIIVQDKKVYDSLNLPKELRSRVVYPEQWSNYNYFHRNGNLYVGAKTKNLIDSKKKQLGKIWWRATSYPLLDTVKDALVNLAETEWKEVWWFMNFIEQLWNWDLIKWFNSYTQPKRWWFGRTYKEVDYSEVYQEYNRLDNVELNKEVERVLSKNWITDPVLVDEANRESIIDWLMRWTHPENDPSLIWLLDATGISKVPLDDKWSISTMIYQALDKLDLEFTLKQVENAADEYIKSWKVNINDITEEVTIASSIEKRLKNTYKKPEVPQKRTGKWYSLVEVWDEYVNKVKELVSRTKPDGWSKIVIKWSVDDTIQWLKTEYTNLWNQYEKDLIKSTTIDPTTGLKEPVSKQVELREKFVYALEKFDTDFASNVMSNFIDDVSKIKWAKYSVVKMTNPSELDLFKQLKERSISEFENRLTRATEEIKLATKEAPSISKNGFEVVDWVKVTVADKLKDLIRNKLPVWSVDNIIKWLDIDSMTKSNQIKLYGILNKINDIYQYYIPTTLNFYMRVNPNIATFFREYEVIKSWDDFLPKRLAQKMEVPADIGINSADDRLLKASILEQVSKEVSNWTLTPSRLWEIIDSEMFSFKWDFGWTPKSDILMEYKKNYEDVFMPYTQLYSIDQKTMDLFQSKLGNKAPVITETDLKEIWDLVIDTPYWSKSVRDLVNSAPEQRLPEVMFGWNSFSKNLDNLPDEFSLEKYLPDQIENNVIDSLLPRENPSILQVSSRMWEITWELIRAKWWRALTWFLEMARNLDKASENAKAAIANMLPWYAFKNIRKASTLPEFWHWTADFFKVNALVKDLMNATDQEFDIIAKRAATPDEYVAITLSKLFRWIRDEALKYVDDPAMVKKFNDIAWSALTATKWETSWLLALYDEIDEWKLFNMIWFDKDVIEWLNKDWRYIDTRWLTKTWIDRFNEIFKTDLWARDIRNIIEWFANSTWTWLWSLKPAWLDKMLVSTWYVPVVSLIKDTSRYAQWFFFGTIPSIFSQIPAYQFKSLIARKWMWDEATHEQLFNYIAQKWWLDEIWPNFRLETLWDTIWRAYMRKLSPTEVNSISGTIRAVAWNAANLWDAFFAWDIFAKHVHWALKSMWDYWFYFRNFDDYQSTLRSMSPENAKILEDRLKSNAMRTYKREIGQIEIKADRTASWWRNDAINLINSLFSKTWWWNNVASNIMTNIQKTWKMISFLGNWWSIDELVYAIQNDFWYQTFVHNLVGQAYMTARAQRIAAWSMTNDQREDDLAVAKEMWNMISYESQALYSSLWWRLTSNLSLWTDEDSFAKIAWVDPWIAPLIQIATNINTQAWSKFSALWFYNTFLEWYDVDWMKWWMLNMIRYLHKISQANLRYNFMVAASDDWQVVPMSSYKSRRWILTGIQDPNRKLSSQFYQLSQFNEWQALRTDKFKDDDRYNSYYYDSNWKIKSESQRTWFAIKEFMKNSKFFSFLYATTGLKKEQSIDEVSKLTPFKEFSENWYFNLSWLDESTKLKMYWDIGKDLFWNQSPLSFNAADSSLTWWFYKTLENFIAGNENFIGNKQAVKWLKTKSEVEIRQMMNEIGEANTIEKRLTAWQNIINKYQSDPQMAFFLVSAIADKEYIDQKKAITDSYKKLNKATGKEDDLKITEMMDQNLRRWVIDKYFKDLQLSDRERWQQQMRTAISDQEAKKDGSVLKNILWFTQKDDWQVYMNIPKSTKDWLGSLMDAQRYFENWESDPVWNAFWFMRKTLAWLPTDQKLAVIAQLTDDIDRLDISPQREIEYKLAILDWSPDLLDKLPEIEAQFWKEIADDYRARWFWLYAQTDKLVDTWNQAQKINAATWAWKWKWSIAFGRVQSPKEINFDLPAISINKIADTVNKSWINSQWRKLVKLDDSFQVKFKSLRRWTNTETPVIPKLNPLWDLSAKSDVYFSEWKQWQKSTQKVKMTSKIIKEIKKKKGE